MCSLCLLGVQVAVEGEEWMVLVLDKYDYSKWFEPKSISSSYCVIVRVSVVLKRTVVGD